MNRKQYTTAWLKTHTFVKHRFASKHLDARVEHGLLVLVFLAGILVPFCLEGFKVYELTLASINVIAILGLNLLTGFSGQISLGHGAFYGLGGYTAAIIMERWGMSAYSSIPVAGAVCFAFGFLFGLPASRLTFLYLAMVTYGLAVTMPRILKSSLLAAWTGGVQGIIVERPGPPLNVSFTDDQWWYFITFGFLVALFWIARNLIKGRTGRAITAIRDHPIAARSMGINVSFYRSGVFGISALYAGIAGALGTLRMDFIAPDSFTFWLSFLFLIGAVVGGVNSISGALIGGLFLQFLPKFADLISKDLAHIVYGLILVLVVRLIPSGAMGMVNSLSTRIQR